MNGSRETKSEIRARIDECEQVLRGLNSVTSVHGDPLSAFCQSLRARLSFLKSELERAGEDISNSILKSHEALCKVKQMGEKDAYGHEPAVFYTLSLCGEGGELANKIVKSLRNGFDRVQITRAVESELPDVIIYAHVLAHCLDLDLPKLVNEKAEIVVQRAYDGYYGGPIKKGAA